MYFAGIFFLFFSFFLIGFSLQKKPRRENKQPQEDNQQNRQIPLPNQALKTFIGVDFLLQK